MTRRVVVVPLLAAPAWTPPGVGPGTRGGGRSPTTSSIFWRTLAEVEPALAVAEADRRFAAAVAWPAMRVYALPRPDRAGDAAPRPTADGFDQAAIVAADAPDLPGMLIAKLLRPLTTRPVAAAPAAGDATGLLGRREPAAGARPGCRTSTWTPRRSPTIRPRRAGRDRRDRYARLAPPATAGGAGPARPGAGRLGRDAGAAQPRRRRWAER